VTVGEQALKTAFADGERDFRDKAAAYDQVLNPSQDAVDATKTAIDELTADGVAQADERMQALQITRTAVNYALVSWRIGRNRTLCGESDGATLDKDNDPSLMRKTSKGRALGEGNKGRRLARIRERVVLYDSTLQSLESIMQLPGVAADSSLLEEIENRRQYFAALR
jgi:signal recognition particle subunit SRP68